MRPGANYDAVKPEPDAGVPAQPQQATAQPAAEGGLPQGVEKHAIERQTHENSNAVEDVKANVMQDVNAKAMRHDAMQKDIEKAQQASQKLKVEDALSYLDQVKNQFSRYSLHCPSGALRCTTPSDPLSESIALPHFGVDGL